MILGAAVIPISIVYTRTIDSTIDTRHQLNANVLLQEYVEAIKTQEMSEIESIMPGGTLTVSGGTDMSAIGLKTLPDIYDLSMSYYISTDIEAIGKIEAGDEPVAEKPVDAIITINSGDETSINVNIDGNNSSLPIPTPANPLIRDIRIESVSTDDGGGITTYCTITYETSEDAQYGTVGPFLMTHNAVRFYMGESGTLGQIDTNIIVRTDTELDVYIYEGQDESINATTEIERGTVRFSRNLTEAIDIPARVIELELSIENNVTGETLATLKSSKFDE